MLNTWDVKDVYDGLMKDYKDAYRPRLREKISLAPAHRGPHVRGGNQFHHPGG